MAAAAEPVGGPEADGSLVGRRVLVGGNTATVRWGPGPLQGPPKAGADATPTEKEAVQVVGIEYDEEGNGKHDGTYQGTRLFVCEHGFGSFVKVDKVELGGSIQRALVEKYFAAMLPEAASKGRKSEEVDDLGYTDSKGREKTMAVELVGRYSCEQRQQRLEGFVEMSLAETSMELRYPEDVWQGDWSLPNLKSLWLDKCLITEWADVAAICELCPNLEWLSLSKTRLKPVALGSWRLPDPKGLPADTVSARIVLEPFQCKVRTLVLNGSKVTWETLLALDELQVFPRLEHLHLAHNGLSEGVPELSGFDRQPMPKLKSIVLDGNGVADWRVLKRAIVSLPSLEALHLNSNELGRSADGLEEVAGMPRRMTAIFLNENKFSTWRDLGALTAIGLLELKVQRIPLTEGDRSVASAMLLRQILIALMPTLLRLNASEVTSKERTSAERYFLSIAANENSSIVKALAEACDVKEHTMRLLKLHGEVVSGDVTEEAQAARASIQNALVEVRLRPIGIAIVDQPEQVKKVPHTMTITELKKLSAVLFKKVPLDRIRLILADPALPFGLPFDDEGRELGFYGVGDGAEIRVDDLADEKGEKKIAADVAATLTTTGPPPS